MLQPLRSGNLLPYLQVQRNGLHAGLPRLHSIQSCPVSERTEHYIHLAVKLGMITESVSWLGNVGSAFWCVVLVAIWKGIPFQMIFILAALQGISGDVYESAEIDGASRWQCFWKITLPIIKEPLAISTILNLIGIVSCFNTIWLMTKGGPLYSTEIIYTYAYRRAFIDHNFGTAAAASVVLFVFMAVFSGVYLKMVSEKE